MSTSNPGRLLFCLSGIAALAGCLGLGTGEIGGTVSGLAANSSVVLQNNNADNLTVSSNQSFTFASTVANGGTYSVTVLTQPVGQTCSVANGSGTVDTNGTDVTNVAVTCVTTASVGGTVTGLPPGTSVTLTENAQSLTVSANGPFAFPGTLTPGSTYTVAISVQPAGHTCTLLNNTGTVVAATMALVTVSCV